MKSYKQLSDEEQREAMIHSATRRYHETMDKLERDHETWVKRVRLHDRIALIVFFVVLAAMGLATIVPYLLWRWK